MPYPESVRRDLRLLEVAEEKEEVAAAEEATEVDMETRWQKILKNQDQIPPNLRCTNQIPPNLRFTSPRRNLKVLLLNRASQQPNSTIT